MLKEYLLNLKKDAGGWFLFFFIVYVILMMKALSLGTFRDSAFFSFYSIVITVYILSRFLLAYFHASPDFDEKYKPTVTFVVPAKNEEDNIAETIRKFSQVNYPKNKIEVITINDGSTDKTLEQMYKIKREIGSLIKIRIVNWKQNRGKREGMAEGVRLATNQIVIFIDSDSFIEKECVRHLTKYFSNPRVGAVSGHTDVFNRDKNILTQMQGVRYYISFKIYKAAESIFGTVTCCPGCCSAYRKTYLVEYLEEWLNQRFLGRKCTFGDDRSLTNFMIRKYEAVYCSEAQAYTVVPDNFRKYLRQQQRWKKSWVRETLIASSFMWRKNFLASISFYTYVFLAFASPSVFLRALVYKPYISHELPIAYLAGLFLMLFLHGLYYRIRVGKRAWILAVLSFWFNTVILMWQLPWAVLTMNDTRWGTR